MLIPPAIALGLCIAWILVLAIPGALMLVIFVLAPALMAMPWSALGLVIVLLIFAIRH